MKLIYQTNSPEETIQLGKRLAERLMPGDTVLLNGELGSGKTHFIKGIADGLGIKETVKSPTYAYVNQFKIKNLELKIVRLYHYDLYRFEKGADVSSIGLDESLADQNAVNLIEWADRLSELPDKYISVNLESDGGCRKIEIHFISPTILTADKIEDYYSEWVTPMNVRAHSRQVAKVAMSVALAYIEKGMPINTDLLYTACMLHDMSRVCDFHSMERGRFKEEVTDEKWQRWIELREKYKGQEHSDIAYDILLSRGFSDTAELIRIHKSLIIFSEPDFLDTIEKKIMYYADKRVKHDEIVSLAERFRDGRERYGKLDTPEQRKQFDEVEKLTKKLEKELFKGLNIGPADIR